MADEVLAQLQPALGGVLFSEESQKGAQFVQLANARSIPLLFVLMLPALARRSHRTRARRRTRL